MSHFARKESLQEISQVETFHGNFGGKISSQELFDLKPTSLKNVSEWTFCFDVAAEPVSGKVERYVSPHLSSSSFKIHA